MGMLARLLVPLPPAMAAGQEKKKLTRIHQPHHRRSSSSSSHGEEHLVWARRAGEVEVAGARAGAQLARMMHERVLTEILELEAREENRKPALGTQATKVVSIAIHANWSVAGEMSTAYLASFSWSS